MKFNLYSLFISIISILLIDACEERSSTNAINSKVPDGFKEYWYAGKAELNSYNLIENRYGEDRAGKSMLVFVTEDFSISKQVKLDNPSSSNSDNASVLKLNMTKNFVTGIYPYSMMLSVFTPVNSSQVSHTLKTTMSSQEWCGQTYAQFNLIHKGYSITSHSYFEKEGDENHNLSVAILEDEIWNRIRIDHESLPVGEVSIIPGLFYSRLQHKDYTIEKAICSKQDNDKNISYKIHYPDTKRALTIEFEKTFPYTIKGWKEEWEANGKTFTTSARLDKQLITDYWTKNKNEFLYLRDSLGLSHQNY